MDEPWTPSAVAVMVAVPFPADVTRPVASTVATARSELAQMKALPGIALPLASLATALNWMVAPIDTRLAMPGFTSTAETAMATDSDPEPATP